MSEYQRVDWIDGTTVINKSRLDQMQTQYLNAAGLKTVSALPATPPAGENICIFNNDLYYWNDASSSWEAIGGGAVDSVNGKVGVVVLTKTDIGLGNVDDTSDLAKPISTDMQTALDGKVGIEAGKGLSTNDYTNVDKLRVDALGTASSKDIGTIAGTIVLLDGDGKIPRAQVYESKTLTSSTKDGLIALTAAMRGDIAVVSADPTLAFNGSYFLNGSYSNIADWVQISVVGGGGGGGAVDSVNGKVGVVVLTASDVGALGVDAQGHIPASAVPVDGTPTAGSDKFLTSGAIYNALAIKANQGSALPTASAEHLGEVWIYKGTTTADAIKGHIYICTFNDPTYAWSDMTPIDGTPTAGSPNPVTSGGVKTAIDAEATRIDAEVAPLLSSVNVTAGASTDLISTEKQGTVHSTPLPVASDVQAGIINTAMYSAYTGYGPRLDALENAVTPLPVTGLTTGMTNEQVLAVYTAAYSTYPVPPVVGTVVADYTAGIKYTWNATDWIYAPVENVVTPFTNVKAGSIKGSTTAGQVFAEADGTGSVGGWDDLQTDVLNNVYNLGQLEEVAVATVGKTDSGAGGLVTLSGYNKAGTLKSSATIKNATSTDAVADENVVLTKAQYDALASGGNGGDYTLYEYPGAIDPTSASNAIVVKRYDGRKYLLMDSIAELTSGTSRDIYFYVDHQIYVDYPILNNITPSPNDTSLDMNIGECQKKLYYLTFYGICNPRCEVISYTTGDYYIKLTVNVTAPETVTNAKAMLPSKFAIRLE